jgi:cyanate lyase
MLTRDEVTKLALEGKNASPGVSRMVLTLNGKWLQYKKF